LRDSGKLVRGGGDTRLADDTTQPLDAGHGKLALGGTKVKRELAETIKNKA